MRVKRKYIPILVHVLLWALLGFVLITYTPLTWGVTLPEELWIKEVFQYAVLISLFYLNAYVIVPRLLLRHRILSFTGVLVGITTGVMLVDKFVNGWLRLPELLDKALGITRVHHHWDFDIFMLMTTLLVLGISTSITAIQSWQQDGQLRLQLQEQQVSSELSFLKAQIHPHFFFNTLNNIYSLTFIDIETSRQALHKLSWMMRYLLYETQNDVTLLSKELRFLKDYIELMRLRLNAHTSVVFEEPVVLQDRTIAPMLLLSFVENAFKHGTSASQGGEIRISVRQQDNRLELEVTNPVFRTPAKVIDDGGIGLSNTQRRLNLLYEGRHHLSYGLIPPNVYRVHLEMELA